RARFAVLSGERHVLRARPGALVVHDRRVAGGCATLRVGAHGIVRVAVGRVLRLRGLGIASMRMSRVRRFRSGMPCRALAVSATAMPAANTTHSPSTIYFLLDRTLTPFDPVFHLANQRPRSRIG